jgi:hypothetical protein
MAAVSGKYPSARMGLIQQRAEKGFPRVEMVMRN